MKIVTIEKALEEHSKWKIDSSDFENFKSELKKITDTLKKNKEQNARENKYTIDLSDFLKATFYKNDYEVKPFLDSDLAIFKNNKLLVLFELKTPTNTSEMVNDSDFNRKAFHEIIWYYLENTREIVDGNLRLSSDPTVRNIVITNFDRFYLIKPAILERILKHDNNYVINIWKKYKLGQALTNNKADFYEEIKVYYQSNTILEKLQFVSFEIEDCCKNVTSKKQLFRILSPDYLLNEQRQKSYVKHTLKRAFYDELIYLMGLKETKEGNSKVVIKIDKERADFIAPQVYKFCREEKEMKEEDSIDTAFQLSIIWINRLLFLKLFEGQLFKINGKTDEFRILSNLKVTSFSDLNSLFFDVLGKNLPDRPNETFFTKFNSIPYLNSALFEKSDVEKKVLLIKRLENNEVTLFNRSIIKNVKKLPLIRYLFDFLDNWDFASSVNETEDEDEQNRIIDAAVLGLIFEKINGYKDGSFYTPSEITEFIAKRSIENIILTRSNEVFGTNYNSFGELKDYISNNDKYKDINGIINGLRFCDPAVGSGHFLVSLLNRIIAVKSELGCLYFWDGSGKIRTHKIEIVNDEILVSDAQNNIFVYDKNDIDSQKVQKTLFNEKRTRIENCLFGVDLNPNAVAICRLRLWIELLKNAYYENNIMQTLPNIDININIGDSLLESSILKTTKKISNASFTKGDSDKLQELKRLVTEYKGESDKTKKRDIKEKISLLSKYFENILSSNKGVSTFDLLKDEMINNNQLSNGVQWLVAFPDLITEEGYFEGFDCVIGNPPFIQIQEFDKEYKKMLEKLNFETYEGSGDIYCLFIELGSCLLKEKGTLCFITSNKWLRSGYGEKTRNYLLRNMNPELLVDLGPGVFENATVDSSIIFLRKEDYNHNVVCCSASKDNIGCLEQFIKDNNTSIDYQEGDNWVILSPIEISIKGKLETYGTRLGDWPNIKINYGLKTGYNDAFIIDQNKRDEIIANCATNEERVDTEKIIRPVLRGKDIRRNANTWNGLYIICTHNGYTKNDGTIVDRIDIVNYPSLKSHLDAYWDKIEQRGDQGDTPYNLRPCAYMDDLNNQKILFSEIVRSPQFYLDDGTYCPEASTFYISGQDLEFLKNYLNSFFSAWVFKKYYAGGGLGESGYRYKKTFLVNLRVPHDEDYFNFFHFTEEEINYIQSELNAFEN